MTISKTEHAVFGKIQQGSLTVQLVVLRQALVDEVTRRAGLPRDEIAKQIAAQMYLNTVEKIYDTEKINILAAQMTSKDDFILNYYQAGSRVIEGIGEEWNVPVAVIGWPVKEKSPSKPRVVVCSNCGSDLKPIGSFLDDVRKNGGQVYGHTQEEDWQQWLGTVCANCNMVFCEKCQDAGWASPCRNCGQPVVPATAGNLPSQQKKLSTETLHSPVSSPKDQKKDLSKRKQSKAWWQFWK